jgi:hypothetical protein
MSNGHSVGGFGQALWGDIRQDQHVMEEFEKVKPISTYNLKDLQALSDSLVSVQVSFGKIYPVKIIQFIMYNIMFAGEATSLP